MKVFHPHGYDTWRRFETAIERAKIACANLGEEVADHFAGAVKMIQAGKGAQMHALLSYGVSPPTGG